MAYLDISTSEILFYKHSRLMRTLYVDTVPSNATVALEAASARQRGRSITVPKGTIVTVTVTAPGYLPFIDRVKVTDNIRTTVALTSVEDGYEKCGTFSAGEGFISFTGEEEVDTSPYVSGLVQAYVTRVGRTYYETKTYDSDVFWTKMISDTLYYMGNGYHTFDEGSCIGLLVFRVNKDYKNVHLWLRMEEFYSNENFYNFKYAGDVFGAKAAYIHDFGTGPIGGYESNSITPQHFFDFSYYSAYKNKYDISDIELDLETTGKYTLIQTTGLTLKKGHAYGVYFVSSKSATTQDVTHVCREMLLSLIKPVPSVAL